MNHRSRWLVLGVMVALFALLVAGCAAPGVTPAETGAEAGDADAGESAGGGTVVWMGHQEVAALGPDDTGPDVQAVLIRNIHNPLVWPNEYNELEPVLAESFEVSEDGLTYTFKLHEGVKFHDGADLTSKDVKYTYDQ